MPDSLMLLVALVAVALIFDFLNGLHDAANSIATVVSTRVLSPNVAVIWAAFFNFIAFLFFGPNQWFMDRNPGRLQRAIIELIESSGSEDVGWTTSWLCTMSTAARAANPSAMP